MRKYLVSIILIFLILSLINLNILKAAEYCEAPNQSTTRTYILNPVCTTTVNICYYCGIKEDQYIHLRFIEILNYCADLDFNAIKSLVESKVLEDWAYLCLGPPCDQSQPIKVNFAFPKCMQYFWDGTILSCKNCSDSFCYSSYSECWENHPPPGHSIKTLIDPCHTEDTASCEGNPIPIIGVDTPPLIPNVPWLNPSVCFALHWNCN